MSDPIEPTKVPGFYVYALRDPRDQQIFYIGKGTGDRFRRHAREARRWRGGSRDLKLERIRSILEAGLDVDYLIVMSGIANEEDAYELERVIAAACLTAGAPLTNQLGVRRLVQSWTRVNGPTAVRARRIRQPPAPQRGGRADIIKSELRSAGERRAAALAELEEVREAVLAKLAELREPGPNQVTWREIAAATHYTETRLQRIWAEREG